MDNTTNHSFGLFQKFSCVEIDVIEIYLNINSQIDDVQSEKILLRISPNLKAKGTDSIEEDYG